MQIGEVVEIKTAFKPNQRDDEGNNLPLGSIKVRVGGTGKIIGNILHRWCRPSKFIRRIPLIGEQVTMYSGPVHDTTDGIVKGIGYYYDYPFNCTDDLALNQLPKTWLRGDNAQGGIDPPGKSFPNPPTKVLNIQPYEGDDLWESRFGSTIRMGSSLTNSSGYSKKATWQGSNGDPITIIAVSKPSGGSGYRVEDISKDDSSIYITTGQKIIKFKSADGKNLDAKKISAYSSPQVILNASQVVLNSTVDDTYILAKNKNIISAPTVVLQDEKYKVTLSDLMDYIEELVKLVNDFATGKTPAATPAGPTASVTTAAKFTKLAIADFKKNFTMP